MAINGSIMFFYCYYGDCATGYYAAIADCLFESNWMALPIDLQKLFILMIGHSQKPIFFIKDMGLWNWIWKHFERSRENYKITWLKKKKMLILLDAESRYYILFDVQNLDRGIKYRKCFIFIFVSINKLQSNKLIFVISLKFKFWTNF